MSGKVYCGRCKFYQTSTSWGSGLCKRYVGIGRNYEREYPAYGDPEALNAENDCAGCERKLSLGEKLKGLFRR